MAGKLHLNYVNYNTSTALANKPANLWGKQLKAYAEGYNYVKKGGVYTDPHPAGASAGLATDTKTAAWAWKQGCADANSGAPKTHV
jgi:hypothetical protein